MKKLDKIIFKAFIGPFVLTLLVCVFIFLIQYLIRYFPDLIGKDLGLDVYIQLLFYFSINVTPMALPLSVLLSSLMTYGNLGEHFELTAIKSAGISLIRTQVPIFIFSILMCVSAFFISNNLVPKANLKAFSLLYDVKQKKPTVEFKEGTFYQGIPGYSIKVNEKLEDGKTMKGVIIYNHKANRGNVEVILADSGRMYTMMNERYLVMDLFRGNSYSEMLDNPKPNVPKYIRNAFSTSKFVFSLESFKLNHTDENLFSSHKIMRNVSELKHDVDSILAQRDSVGATIYLSIKPFYQYLFNSDTVTKPGLYAKSKNYGNDGYLRQQVIRYAANTARSARSYVANQKERADYLRREANNFDIEWYRKFTFSFACLVMFLIGAPLGSIIKKGGLGVPVIVSIVFFIFYYIFSNVTEKWAKESIVNVTLGMWFANLIFLPIGLFFLRQARNDSRLFESDYFAVLWGNLKMKFRKNKK